MISFWKFVFSVWCYQLENLFEFSAHGKEYGFGAHDFPVSGVFEVEPRSCPGYIYRCSIALGSINMSPSEFRTLIENMASEYHGDTYHLISKNCNHFTDDVSRRLTDRSVPGWVNRLAHLGKNQNLSLPGNLMHPHIACSSWVLQRI